MVTLLTESRGKVALMARGARKSKKRFAGALEPYCLIEAELAMGRGEVGRLAEARVVRAFPGLLTSLEKIGVAAAGLEVVRELVPDHEPPDERLLPTVVRFLERLEETDPAGIEGLRIAFDLRLLALTGHSPNLETCGHCGTPAPEGKAALFSPRAGAIVCRACGGAPYKLGGRLRMAMIRAGTRTWDQPDPDLGPEARRPLEELLEHLLSRRLAGEDLVTQVRAITRRSEP
ncbi:MAG: DNA repair protein RecO [Myxococcales bacterium]|nr:DNA repair protein RecO [Myxococcales bacterium]MCA9613137.1 DNA repair protein RecO [Myxococcales bacterium]